MYIKDARNSPNGVGFSGRKIAGKRPGAMEGLFQVDWTACLFWYWITFAGGNRCSVLMFRLLSAYLTICE